MVFRLRATLIYSIGTVPHVLIEVEEALKKIQKVQTDIRNFLPCK